MGCNSSVPNAVEVEGSKVKVLQLNIHMTYDYDDSDNETCSPTKPHICQIKPQINMRDTLADEQNIEPAGHKKLSSCDSITTTVMHTAETTTQQHVLLNLEADSDDDSDYYDSIEYFDEDENSDDDDNDDFVAPCLKSIMLSMINKSRSTDKMMNTHESVDNLSLLSSRSFSFDTSDYDCDCDCDQQDTNVIIRQQSQKLMHKHISHSISSSWSTDSNSKDNNIAHNIENNNNGNKNNINNNNEDSDSNAMQSLPQHEEADEQQTMESPNKACLLTLRSEMSYESDPGGEVGNHKEDDDEVVVIGSGLGLNDDRLMLRGMLTFRSTALTLREDAKKFRNVLKEMKFDENKDCHCKYTCTYILYKMKTIIALNSALSKFVNDNALKFLNPFLDHSELTATLHTLLKKLLVCIARTKIDNITVSGQHSRVAAIGLVTIFELIADLSPDPSAIEAKVQAIRNKLKLLAL